MGDMSRFEDEPRSYLLAGFIGVIRAVTTIASNVLYLKIWDVTLTVLQYSSWFVFSLLFRLWTVSFVLVRLFAEFVECSSHFRYSLGWSSEIPDYQLLQHASVGTPAYVIKYGLLLEIANR